MPPETTDSGTGPQACISIRLSAFGKLWGLIVCHSHRLDLRIHPLARRLCWFVSEIVSSNIERLSYTLPFQFKDQATTEDLHKCREIQTPSGDLLSIFGADYAVASILDESKIMGKPAESQEILALLEYFRAKELGTVIWSTDILSDLEDLEYPLGFHILSSLLYIPLLHDGHDFIIFFRSNKKTENENPEQDLNHALDWSAAEFGKASMLSLLYRTFTDVWQENEATTQSNQLMRLLLANSAHEFRTPLNAIINYLEIALDGNLNQETRENLSRSHSASKSLIYIINDLLDLTNAENGQNLIKDEVFSLSDTLSEATDIFWEEARQKDVDIQVVQHSTLPAVLGDQRRVRQVITNLISNAVQHTSHGAVTIESCVLSECWESGHIAVEVAIHDTGSGMSQEAVEALFCELEQESWVKFAAHETENVLGLGLALVARIVRNMDGQLSLRSEQGKGSCFKIRLKFPVPSDGGEAPPTSRNGSNMNIASADGNGRVRNDLASDLSAGTAQDASTDEAKRETYQGTEKSSKIPTGGSYTCGDEVFPRSKQVDVNVELENGESRNLVIGSGGTEEMIQKGKTDESQEICTGHANEASPKVQVQGALDGSDATLKVKQENETSHEQPAEHGKPIGEPVQPKQLHVLVAEDDPINSMIVKKRLEKFGYSVYLTGNGKECAAAYSEPSTSFDLILMDLQFEMPIVDGIGATKMIRDYEHQMAKGGLADQQERLQKRIPIFAVSATLFEKDRQVYLDAGFDGWIVKPIDFQRVHSILDELVFTPARDTCLRKSGVWEEGGWFEKLA
ncbi:CheY-like superfamily [Penicillium chermesinum]|uniref:histidine kinase n=1 Tax=Penicillium chermesinum TaxID=63820 RepID=A0A9W9NTW5_9EURO|nr:CheY-like superfamily [Penicillium chermesinum]KAJ5226049.1 CheY-like superfamily [Penicillium chermesinum]